MTRTEQGTSVVTWTFDDGHGNTSTQTQNIVVSDVTAPVADAATLADATGECSASITSAPTATDNCSGTITGTTSDDLTRTTQGTSVVTWTFDDGHGNTSTQTQNIVVSDVTAPVADVATLADATGECSATITAAPTATDNCSGTITGTTNDDLTRTEQGTSVVTWTFDDGHGNTSTQTQNIVVSDVTAPAAPALADATGECSVSVSTPTAEDNCSGTITGTTADATTYTTQGTYTIHWSFDDGNGNISTTDQTVIVKDVTAPTIICAADVSVNNDLGQCSAAVTLNTPATGDNCGVVSVTNDHPSDVYPVGETDVTWTVKDVNNNTTSCVQKVTVTDNEKPSISCSGDVSVNNDPGQCSAQVTLSAPATSDNCGGSTVTSDHPSTTYPVGTTTVTWTATDNHGNTRTCTQTVIVTDNEAPQITCPANITASTDSSRGYATRTLSLPVVSDNCGTTTVTNNHYSTRYPIGTTVVTWTVTDAHGNMATCQQTVIVNDTEGPRILCGGAITVNNDPGRCDANVVIHIPYANDNSGHVSLTVDYPGLTVPPFTPTPTTEADPNARPTTSAVFPVGITTLTWTATDSSGNSSSCTQNITVIDNEKPIVSCSGNVAKNNDAGQCSAQVTLPTPSNSDNCGIQSVTNDHPSNTYPVGTTTVTWTVTDIHNNTNTCSQTVTVTDSEKPVITCGAAVSVNSDNGICGAAITLSPPSTSDNCAAQPVSNNHPSNIYPVGTTVVTWTVSDAAGNTASCNQTVTVTDATKPVANCKPATVTLVNGTATVSASQVNNNSSDACGIQSLSVFPNTFNCSNIGGNTVTLTVTDNNNNTSTCQATVTVVGSVPTVSITQSNLPTFCQGTQVILTANANMPVTYTWSGAQTTQSINVTASGTYSVTVKNSYGCTASASKAVMYDNSSQLSSYVILATDKVDMNTNTVNSGGVGVTDIKGKADIKDNSKITAPGTFLKSPDIKVNGGSVVTIQITAVANVTLPAFISNPYNTNTNINTSNGSTTTLTGNNYGNIDIGENATVIFTQGTVYAKKLKVKKNSIVKFSGCTDLILKEGLDLDENNKFNLEQYRVTVYAGGNVEVDKGSTVYSNIYAEDKDIHTKNSKNAAPINMYGMFIGKQVKGEDNTFWNYGTFCNSCTPLALRSSGTEETEQTNIAVKAGVRDVSFMSIKAYPNPFSNEMHLLVNSPDQQTAISVKVMDITGRIFETRNEIVSGNDVVIGKSLSKGVYIIQVTQGENKQVTRIVKAE